MRRKLPTVWSRGEGVCTLLDATTNTKHRALLAVYYSAGLRCFRKSLDLKGFTDIDSKRIGPSPIRRGQGKFPRQVMLSPKLLELLRVYWKWRKPKGLALPRSNGRDHPLFQNAVRVACQKIRKQLGITKPLSPHVCCDIPSRHRLCSMQEPICAAFNCCSAIAIFETTARYLHVSEARLHATRRGRSTSTCPFAIVRTAQGGNRTSP